MKVKHKDETDTFASHENLNFSWAEGTATFPKAEIAFSGSVTPDPFIPCLPRHSMWLSKWLNLKRKSKDTSSLTFGLKSQWTIWHIHLDVQEENPNATCPKFIPLIIFFLSLQHQSSLWISNVSEWPYDQSFYVARNLRDPWYLISLTHSISQGTSRKQMAHSLE